MVPFQLNSRLGFINPRLTLIRLTVGLMVYDEITMLDRGLKTKTAFGGISLLHSAENVHSTEMVPFP